MKKSLSKKLCLVGMSLIAAFVLSNIILAYFFLIPLTTYQNRRQMEKMMKDIECRIDYTDEKFSDYIDDFTEEMDVWITVVNEDKKILHTTKKSDLEKEYLGPVTNDFFDANVERMERGETAFLAKTREKNKNIVMLRLMKKTTDNRYTILSRSYRSLQDAATSAIIFDVLVGIVFILAGFFVVYKLSRRIVDPVRDMQNAAEHIARLEFGTKVDIKSEDELGQLGHSINIMSEHLESNMILLQNDIESRKRLVRNLSHEIKSPVAVIMGYADRLKAIISLDTEKALRYCEIISNESVRADILVKEMLEFSRLEQKTEELQTEIFSVGSLFEHIRRRFEEEYMEKSIQYLEEYDGSENIKADYLLLERAIYNLIRNAVAYGADEHLVVRIKGMRKQEYYEIRVYNSGSMIKEEDRQSIWEAFSKADKARTPGTPGFGVGLSIVREIVEAHHGYYGFENAEDGVEFYISIKG